jgi:CheY-like chemotaxis protein
MACPVLVIEDDPELREMMAQLLTLEGYDATTASNGRAALDLLHGGCHPHVILLDLMMPVMDGWEFRRRQIADPALQNIAVLVLTAAVDVRDVGAAAVLPKPLDFDALLSLVRSHC